MNQNRGFPERHGQAGSIGLLRSRQGRSLEKLLQILPNCENNTVVSFRIRLFHNRQNAEQVKV
jgi:hypothetical protein